NLTEKTGVSPELARAYANLCVAVGLVGIQRLADEYRRRAIATAEILDDPATLARVLARVSLYDNTAGRWERAAETAQRAINLAKTVGDMRQWGEAMVIHVTAL